MKYSAKEEQALMVDIFSYADDPLGYVLYAFPWGEKGTPLERHKGPRKWQARTLRRLGVQIERNRQLEAEGKDPEALYLGRASGRGIGKSALFSMVALWMESCHPGATTIITANTEGQLLTKTMPELGRWHMMAINSHWFEKTAMALKPAAWFGELVQRELKIDTQYYYAQAITWSEENPDAFAGAHSQVGMMLIMDEASGIPENIFDVSEGFFTDLILHRYWLMFSNPRQNSGGFYRAFHGDRNNWDLESIDARTVEGSDQSVYERIIQRNGIESDPARVEVLGLFPNAGSDQFIPADVVREARKREVEDDLNAPLLMGVDVARFGDDRSVCAFRQGRNAAKLPWKTWSKVDTVFLADQIAGLANKHKPDAIFVDGGGVGGGVVDQLNRRGFRVIEVGFGDSADDKNAYANRRTEMWAKMGDWLSRGAIPDDDELENDLIAPTYSFVGDNSTKMLEKKKDMKKRGQASPDKGDALAMTFDRQIARREYGTHSRPRMCVGMDYDIFGE